MDIDSFEREILRVAPEFRGASFAPLGQGMDNHAVLVADEFVFRFPRHPEAAARIRREIALLPNLAPGWTSPFLASCTSVSRRAPATCSPGTG